MGQITGHFDMMLPVGFICSDSKRIKKGQPDRALAVVPLPDDGVDQDTIQQWLDDGLAHVAGGVILYDGGEQYPLTIEEWQARYCTGDSDKSRH